MNILLFEGRGQYNTPPLYIDKLSRRLVARGHNTFRIDLTDEPPTQAILEEITRMRESDGLQIDFSFSLNGMYPAPLNNRDLFEIIEIPHFTYLIDHPFHHMSRFVNPASEFLYYSCVDRSHLDYLSEFGQPNCMFLPHAVSERDIQFSSPEDTDRGLVFFGTVNRGTSLLEYVEKQASEDLKKLANDVTTRVMKRPEVAIYDHLKFVLKKRNLTEALEQRSVPEAILGISEKIFRTNVRVNLVKQLTELDFEIYGNVSDELNVLWREMDNRIHDPVSEPSMFEVMDRSTLSLNISHFFPDGSHKRVMDSLARGTPVLTTRSKFFEQEFGEYNVLSFFSPLEDSFGDTACEALNRATSFMDNMEEAQEYVKENHTWDVRADQILSRVQDTWF